MRNQGDAEAALASAARVFTREYYQQHINEYKYEAQVKWEELMVRFDKFGGDRDAAWSALAKMGNQAWTVIRANPAARAWLGTDAAEGWRLLRQAAGSRLETWLREAAHAIDTGRAPPPAPPLKLADGQRATLHLLRERPNWLLHARLSPVDPGEPPLGEWMAKSRIDLVEPTWSAWSMMCGGHSGCAATGAPGCSALSLSNSVSLNAWWTMQMPGQSSMSRPVLRAR